MGAADNAPIALARAPITRSELLDADDLRALARATLQRCLTGKVDPRTAEVQRKTAEFLLSEPALEHLTDEQLNAEVARINAEITRRLAKRAQP